MKAEIKFVDGMECLEEQAGLWLLIDKEDLELEGVAFPLEEDEIEPVRDACNQYLKTKND